MARFIVSRRCEVKTKPPCCAACNPKSFNPARSQVNDAVEAAAVFSTTFKSMTFVPKLHSDAEDQAFVLGFIADGETWIALRDGRIVGLACIEDE